MYASKIHQFKINAMPKVKTSKIKGVMYAINIYIIYVPNITQRRSVQPLTQTHCSA